MARRPSSTAGLIKVRCPNASCRKVLAVKHEMAGRKAKCPLCGQTMSIPKKAKAKAVPEGAVKARPPAQAPEAPSAAGEKSAARAAPADEGAAPSPGKEGPAETEAPVTAPEAPSASEKAPEPAEDARHPATEEPAPAPAPAEPAPKPRADRRAPPASSYMVEGGTPRVVGPMGYDLNPEFQRRCHELVDTGEKELTVDLSDVMYISSSHIGVLAELAVRATKEDRKLTIRAGAKATKVLKFAGLDRMGRLEEA